MLVDRSGSGFKLHLAGGESFRVAQPQRTVHEIVGTIATDAWGPGNNGVV